MSFNFRTSYGFAGHLREEFPSQVIIDATDICNLSCRHCPHSEFRKSRYYQGCFLDPELSAKAVDEVRLNGAGITQYIRFTGEGEPLIHKEIHTMLSYAAKNAGCSVTFTTNGTLMNEAHVERLVYSGVDVVDISLDAFRPETYAIVRAKGNLEITRTNVLRLIEAAQANGSRPKVVVSFIEQPLNAMETDDFEKYWREHGADYVVVRRLHSGAGMLEKEAAQMRSSNEGKTRRPCTYPWERIVLNPRGCLSFCPADWIHASTVADYRTTTIGETWRGNEMNKVREAHLTNDYSRHQLCGQCPDWAATRWPSEGRSYRDMIEDFKKDK